MQERPKPPMDNTPVGNEPSGGMKMPSGGVMLYVIVVVIAIIAAFGVNYMFGVSKSSMDTQTKATSAALAAMQSDLKASKDSINTAITAINPAVTKQVADGLKSINDQITKLQSSIDTASNASQSATNQVANLSKSIADWQTQLNTIKADVTALKSSTADADLKTALNAVADRVTSLETKVTTLNTQVTALMTPTTTTTTGNTSGINGVYATIIPNAWGGGQTVSFPVPAATPSTSQIGNFSFNITNTTKATANNIQLAIGLQTVTGAGTTITGSPIDLTLPIYNVTVSIGINGYFTTWTTQATGYTGLIAFTNTIPSGTFASMGTLSQVVGTSQSYTVNITVTTGTSTTFTPLPPYTIIPIVKVVSFN